MARFRLVEIHEQRWFPSELRTAVTDLLQLIVSLSGYHRSVKPLLEAALKSAKTNSVVDLCSGGGGPWPDLLQAMRMDGTLSLCLTDKYPNIASFEKIQRSSQHDVHLVREPIDAECVPRELRGLRTLFNSFHHFHGPHAEHVLADAVEKGQGVAVFEVPQKRAITIFATFLMALGTLLCLPFIRPFRFSLFFWTYVVPLLPFVMWFDGAVSCLRCHSVEELRELVAKPSMRAFVWSCGSLRDKASLAPVTFLIGCRQVDEHDRPQQRSMAF
jgi:hypothetical protein